MVDKLLIKRGAQAGIPTAADGEPLWTTDTMRLYVGQGGTNRLVGDASFSAVTTAGVSGDLLTVDAFNAWTRLGIGSNNRVLRSNGSLPSWAQVALSTDVTGTLPVVNGGTGQSSYTDGQILIGNSSGNTLTKASLTGTANQVTVTPGGGSITLSLPQNVHTGASPTFAGATLSGATASRLLATDGSKALTSVGNLADWIAGTANQVTVTNDGDGTVTLSLPQNVHTSATPQFGYLGLGAAADSAKGVNLLLGAAADKGFFVKLAASHTGNALEVHNNGGITLAYIAANGEIHCEPTATATSGTTQGLRVLQTSAPTATSSGNHYAHFATNVYNGGVNCTGLVAADLFQMTVTSSATFDDVAGMWGNCIVSSGSTPTIAGMYGYRLSSFDAEDATVTNAYAAYLQMCSVDTGAITTCYGLRLQPGTIGAGSITNQIGIYIPNITGATTVNQAIRTDGGAIVLNENGTDSDTRIEGDADANLFFLDASVDRIGIGTNAPGTKLDVNGVVKARSGVICQSGALTTTATDGFVYIPTCAGAPTGVPTAQTGTAAMVYDTTNNKLCVYNGAWKSVTLA